MIQKYQNKLTYSRRNVKYIQLELKPQLAEEKLQ